MGTELVQRWAVCLVHLVLIIFNLVPSGLAVDSLEVALDGAPGTDDFLQVGSGLEYQLRCQYRAAYDDRVQTVTWTDFGREVYSYSYITNSTTVSPPLRGLVSLTPSSSPHNIHITKAAMVLTGTYACRVTSSKETVESKPINVRVIDIATDDFWIEVDVLSNLETANSTTSNETSTTEEPPSNTTSFGPPGPSPTDDSCMLNWSFGTPAIAPRPSVTCGVYSYSHDDIKGIVAGGLQLHQLQNNSWLAEIIDTRIPVIEIPYQGRLGCKITIPNTSYRKIVKFEDGLTVDHLIDSKGCPTLEGLTDYFGIQHEVKGATPTCRGNLKPSSKLEAVRATLSCPGAARFRDGRMVRSWQMELSCIYQEMIWRELSVAETRALAGLEDEEVNNEDASMVDDDMMPNVTADSRKISDTIDIEKYPWPLCVGRVSANLVSAAQISQPASVLISLVIILAVICF